MLEGLHNILVLQSTMVQLALLQILSLYNILIQMKHER